jgi:uncharacterized protein
LKFTRELPSTVTIRSVANDSLIIGDVKYGHTIAVTTDKVLENWTDKPVANLVLEDFEDLLADSPAIVVLGTGSSNIFAPRELVFAFARQSVGLEVMDTKAAARTFNVLAGEGRAVAAVLYLK